VPTPPLQSAMLGYVGDTWRAVRDDRSIGLQPPPIKKSYSTILYT
jgi:hypothetical protein